MSYMKRIRKLARARDDANRRGQVGKGKHLDKRIATIMDNLGHHGRTQAQGFLNSEAYWKQ